MSINPKLQVLMETLAVGGPLKSSTYLYLTMIPEGMILSGGSFTL